MEWDYGGRFNDLDDHIIDFCEYTSKRLVLDELLFAFSITVEIMKQLVAGCRANGLDSSFQEDKCAKSDL